MPSTPSYKSDRKCLLQLAILLLSINGPVILAEDEANPETVVSVYVGSVVKTTLHSYVTGYGTVETAAAQGTQPAGGARLAPALPGLVTAVPGIEGQRVEKGSLLIQLNSGAADAAVERATRASVTAEKARARQSQLQAANGTSERAVLEAEERLATARAELASAQLTQSQHAIRAPIAGVITRLEAKPGEWLDTGKDVAEIVDFDRLVFAVQIPLADAASLKVGQPASLLSRLDSNEKPLVEGTLQFVSPRVTPGANSVLARIALPAGAAVRPGQFTAVRIVTETHVDCLAVPRESIYTDGGGRSTLSVVEEDMARQQTVLVGLYDGDLIEVSGEGLSEDTKVVTLGSYALPQQTKIRVISANQEDAK